VTSSNPPRSHVTEACDGLDLWLSLLAHDVRAPLQLIDGYARILDGQLTHPDQQRALAHIQTAGAEIRELLSDVLAANRPEQNARGNTPSGVTDLAKVLNEAVASARGQADLRGVTISAWESNTPLPIVGHPVKARHALLNVLTNAVAHGGGVVTIEAPIIEQHHVLITVRDEGPGLPTEGQSTPLKARTANATRQNTRRGRGLRLAGNLMREMAGSLTYAPSPTHPGTFILRFERALRPP